MKNQIRQTISHLILLLLLLGVSAGTEAAVLTVANNSDSGPGSLRQAVLDAAPGDTIDFNAGITLITLASSEIGIGKNLTINGPGARILTISGNNANRIFNITTGTVVISGVTITNGFAAQGWAGGILNSGNLTLNKATIINNSAASGSSFGGGIYNDTSATMTLNEVTVAGNSADTGAGIYSDIGSSLTINNSTISGNAATVQAGGIFMYEILSLYNTTVTNNIPDGISGIFAELTLQNSIIAGNSGTDLNIDSPPTSSVHNLIQSTSLGSIGGANIEGVSPLLGPLTDNGGPTQTHAPLSGSPALNAGDPATCLPKDQRGITRPLPTSCDIGAVEPTCNWTGTAADGKWGTAGNWDCGHVPDGADHTNITLSGTYAIDLDQAGSVLDMILGAASGAQTLSITGGSDFSLSLGGASTIAVGGVLSVTNQGSQVSSVGLLTNNGAITLDNGTYVSANLKNTGTVTVTGATPSALIIGGYAGSNSGTITANGSFNIDMTSTGSFTNTGTIDTGAGGTVTFNGTGLGSFTNSSGGVVTGSGTVNVTNISSGSFSSGGKIKPGSLGANGQLSITGGMVMTGGDLYIVISGSATPGTDYDQVSVSGAATINGTLNVTLNSYDPLGGNSFTVMTCGSGCDSGTFVPNLPALTGGKSWNIAYNPTSVVLSVANETIPPTDGNGTLSAVAGDAQVSLSWPAASDSGGSGVASYLLAFSTVTAPAAGCSGGSDIGNITSYNHSSLTNGTTYHYRVCVKDAAGNVSTGLVATATPVALLSQAIGIIGFTPSTLTVGGSSTASATGGGSGNPVVFSSATPSVCTAGGTNGSTITAISAGVCTIAADQAGNASYYAAPQVSQNITVNKATPVITWSDPAAITYGTVLSGTQLNASANVPGSFVYSPASGTTLNAGVGQTLSVTFTPSDTSNYNSTGASVTLTVNKAAATVTLGNLAQTYDGTAKPVGVTTVPAGLTVDVIYNGSALVPATAGSYAVAASVTDPNYSGSAAGTLVINKATPVISWSNPASITYGTALSGTQLNASSGVPGSFVYTPASGTVLNAGAGQTISATFTPSDTANYNNAGASVSLTVNQAVATITLGNTVQTYDGSAKSVSITTTPAGLSTIVTYDGSVTAPVNAGSYAVAVSISDPNYSGSASATLTIGKASPVVTWPTALAITYGQTLSSSTLSGGSSTPTGSFTFTTPANAPTAGISSQSVTFTPADSANYNTATNTVSVTVNKADASITWPTASAITYGQTLAASTLTGGSSTSAGAFAWTTPATVPVAGTASQSVTFTPTDTANFNSAANTVSVAVNKADATITWPTASAITYGQTLASSTLSGGTSTPVGAFAWTTSTTVPNAGTASQSVTFTPVDTANYNNATSTVSVTVNKADATITWPTASTIIYGQTLAASTLTGGTSTPAGAFAWTTPATAPNAGTASQSVTFTPADTANYNTATSTVSVAVNKATASVTLSGLSQTYDGTLRIAGATTVPAGLSTLITYDGSIAAPIAAGSYTVAADVSDTNYSGGVSGTLVVAKATPVITWGVPADIFQGTALSATQLNATASVPGSFVYSPASGVIPAVGTQTLSVTFTPMDSANYTVQTATVSLTVTAVPANQVTTGADGRTTTQITVPVSGATVSLPSGTLLTDASGNPISGTLTVTASVMNSIGALPTNTAAAQTSDGKLLSVLGNSIDITISAGASTVKTINPPMIVNLPVASTFALPGATVSYYSFDGAKWQLEGTAVVKSDNTVDMSVGHLSVWAVAVFAAAVDSTPPVVSSFSIPATSSTLLVPVSSLIATDDVAVTGYLLSESAVAPLAADSTWTAAVPADFLFPTWGNHTLYAYAKDAAGNISAVMAAPVFIGSDPAVDGVVVPALPADPPKLEPKLPDAMKSLNFAMKVEIPTATEILHGDVAPLVNGVPQPDGKINLGDTIVILRRVVGL